MVHKKGHWLYSELQHYGTMINGPCKGASTPCCTWTLQYHSPPSPPKGFFFLHPEHEHHSTVVHSPCKRASILSRTQTPNDVSLWTNPLKSHDCMGGVDVSTSAAKQSDRKLSNSETEREIFSSNTLISPPTSISASSKKAQLEFVCFSNKQHKNIPSVAVRLWHRGLQVHCWF